MFNLNLRRCIEATETDMGSVQEVVRNTRSLRAAYNLPPKSKPDLFIVTRTPAAKAGTCILHPKSSFKLTSNDPSHRTNSSQPTQYVT